MVGDLSDTDQQTLLFANILTGIIGKPEYSHLFKVKTPWFHYQRGEQHIYQHILQATCC